MAGNTLVSDTHDMTTLAGIAAATTEIQTGNTIAMSEAGGLFLGSLARFAAQKQPMTVQPPELAHE